MRQADEFASQYLAGYRPYKSYWNYEDGCVLTGCVGLWQATGDAKYRDFVLKYLGDVISPDGVILNFPMDKYNIDSINCGKALFFALDETGDQRYRKALDFLIDRLKTHPRCAVGNYWHKEIYPEQIWLDGLYMAQPFSALYEKHFGAGDYSDLLRQFALVRDHMRDEKTGLYYHGYDASRRAFWCDKATGLSANFWLRAIGWCSVALADLC
jgi:unsaturated rhamnogalacturonyl hydrolase